MDRENIIKKIKENINEKIRPMLIMDGGNIEFVDYEDGILKVKLLGACHGCPMAGITLKNAVQDLLKETIPEIEKVIAIDYEEENE